eukprot:gene23203-29399_t
MLPPPLLPLPLSFTSTVITATAQCCIDKCGKQQQNVVVSPPVWQSERCAASLVLVRCWLRQAVAAQRALQWLSSSCTKTASLESERDVAHTPIARRMMRMRCAPIEEVAQGHGEETFVVGVTARAHGNAPWVNMTAQIGGYVRNAVSAYVASIDTSLGTTVDSEVDLSNAKPGLILPIVPDVALQYRCGDNIGFSYMYGILPFAAFKPLIPADSKYIYVLSDHPSRAAHSVYSGRCSLILKALMEYLQVLSPNAIIVVKRGGDLFLDYVRLSRAKVTICSASSYCLWPALSNVNGSVHFPLTSLAAGADSIELAPDFGSHFQWIAEPKIISNFKNVRPWTAIIDILRADVPSKPA